MMSECDIHIKADNFWDRLAIYEKEVLKKFIASIGILHPGEMGISIAVNTRSDTRIVF